MFRLGNNLNRDSLDLIERDLISSAVVKLGRARAGVRRHLLGLFQRAFVVQVIGDAGGAEGMATDRRFDSRQPSAAADHPPDIGGLEIVAGEFVFRSRGGAEARAFVIGGVDVFVEIEVRVALEQKPAVSRPVCWTVDGPVLTTSARSRPGCGRS
jgi:hypothetical protein